MESRDARSQNPTSLEEFSKPSAMDVAITAMTKGMIVMAVTYIVDWFLHPHGIITPQSSEERANQYMEITAAPSTTQQNVKFIDSRPGYIEAVKTEVDDLRLAPLSQDATLDDFFCRPVKIQTLSWGVGATFYEEFDPWSLYFNNIRVVNRISNYKLLHAKLHVKFMLNGTPFHYGRLIVSYNPLPISDDMTIDRPFVSADIVAASQRPHVYLNPTCSIGAEMVLPFFVPTNLLDIVDTGWDEMGQLCIHSMQGLKHANGAVDSVSISVFAWAEEVKFAIPTQFEPGSITPQSDEYGDKPISTKATAVANMMSNLVKVPYIGPYALATQIGANAIGNAAKVFGYSAPTDFSITRNHPVAKGNFAATNMPDSVFKLTVDCKQELTVDPRIAGLANTDEMAIANIATRESWIDSFEWQLGRPEEALLYNIVVDPCVHKLFNNGNGTELHLPACCFASVPFRQWRGSMRYRFQVVCSNYHRGRLKIVYDPTSTPIGTSEYNVAYTTVVDISDNTDFTIDVGWAQHTTFKEHIKVGTLTQDAMMGNLSIGTATPAIGYGNGHLAVYVVNELTVPDTTIDNDISINVFVSALDDFELAQPDGLIMNRLRLTTATQLEPQSEEVVEQEDSIPVDPPKLDAMAQYIALNDGTNLVHFGETIKSFRQLVKRYEFHEILRATSATDNIETITYVRNMFPYYPGYGPPSGLASLTGAGNYYYASMTLLNYLTSAYGGWRGSIRYAIDATRLSNPTNRAGLTVTHSPRGVPGTNSYIVTALANPASIGSFYQNNLEFMSTFNGMATQPLTVNPIISTEIPYYSRYRFAPAKRRIQLYNDDTYQQKMYTSLTYAKDAFNDRAFLRSYISAGEDFSLYFYLGPPVFYYEPDYPEA